MFLFSIFNYIKGYLDFVPMTTIDEKILFAHSQIVRDLFLIELKEDLIARN